MPHKEGKKIKAWMVVYKRTHEPTLPDVFRTKEQAIKRMGMNEYQKHQRRWMVHVVEIRILPAKKKTKNSSNP